MKKQLITALLCSAMLLTACECKHEERNEADCTTPQTCADCGLTMGEATGHEWLDASCEFPKTCKVCETVEGTALGHQWQDATCESPKTCVRCEQTEGELAAHTWEEATCKAPQTCSVCNETQGEKTDQHNWIAVSCAKAKHCSVCGKTEGDPLPHTWEAPTCVAPQTCSVCKKTGEEAALGHRYVLGTCSVCGNTDPDYVLPASVETYSDLTYALRKNFGEIVTPFGTLTGIEFELDVSDTLTSRDFNPYDFYIQVDANFSLYGDELTLEGWQEKTFTFPSDLESIYITDAQRAEVVECMKNYQRQIADFAMAAFPDAKITGGFYYYWSSGFTSSGNYLNGGSNRYFTWCNFGSSSRWSDYAIMGSYDESYLTQFHWDDKLDDDWYGYNFWGYGN